MEALAIMVLMLNLFVTRIEGYSLSRPEELPHKNGVPWTTIGHQFLNSSIHQQNQTRDYKGNATKDEESDVDRRELQASNGNNLYHKVNTSSAVQIGNYGKIISPNSDILLQNVQEEDAQQLQSNSSLPRVGRSPQFQLRSASYCYHCKSFEENCLYPKEEQKESCNAVCYTMLQDNGHTRLISRSCGDSGVCSRIQNNLKSVAYCVECTGDLCNGELPSSSPSGQVCSAIAILCCVMLLKFLD